MLVCTAADFILEESGGDGFFRPTEGVHFLDELESACLNFSSKSLDVVASRQWIGSVRDSRLVRHNLLSTECELGRFCRRQRQGFVITVRVQRLSSAESRGECLYCYPDDVIEGLLGGERDATCLRVKPQTGADFRSTKSIAHDASIQPSSGAELGDFLEQIAVRCEKEGKSRSEGIDGEAGFDRATDVLDRVR